MGISEGLFLSRFVNSSDTLARLTVTLGTEPKQPDIKLGALISQCVLTLIRSSVFHGLTDGGGRQDPREVTTVSFKLVSKLA